MGKRLFAPEPDGSEIVGTVETIPGTSMLINRDIEVDAAGRYDFMYSSETKVHWDEQKTVEEDGERLFLSEGGNSYRESELVLKEEES